VLSYYFKKNVSQVVIVRVSLHWHQNSSTRQKKPFHRAAMMSSEESIIGLESKSVNRKEGEGSPPTYMGSPGELPLPIVPCNRIYLSVLFSMNICIVSSLELL
jgi:hypothetical protein